MRFMIQRGGYQHGTHVIEVMKRPFRLICPKDDTPQVPYDLGFRSPSRWNLRLGLRMPLKFRSPMMVDHRGKRHRLEIEAMSQMPGYFDDFRLFHEPGNKRFNQNSTQMANFYLLRYGELYRADLRGSVEFLVEDMALAKMVHAEELGRV